MTRWMLPPDSVPTSRSPAATRRSVRSSSSASVGLAPSPSRCRGRLRYARQVAERHVLGDREAGHDGVGHRVLGHADRPGGDRPPRGAGACPSGCAADRDGARRRGCRSPRATSYSSRWPLPATPATPTSSPARTLEVDVVSAVPPPCRSTVTPGQHQRRRRVRRADRRSGSGSGGDGPPHHRLDQLVVGHGLRVGAAHDQLAAPQHRDPVGDRPGLAELVGDDHHRQALCAQLGERRRTARRPPGGRARWSARRGSPAGRRPCSTLRISTRWRSPIDRSRTFGVGLDRQPEARRRPPSIAFAAAPCGRCAGPCGAGRAPCSRAR